MGTGGDGGVVKWYVIIEIGVKTIPDSSLDQRS